MSGNSFVLDTNIILYLLSGNKSIAELLDNTQLYISFITQLELLGYFSISETEQAKIKEFLEECVIVDINEEIKRHTIQLKQSYKIKLPDSIIAATSLFLEIPLLTADKEFNKIAELNLAIYED